MPLHQTPPGRGGRPARVFWVYIPTGKGESWHAHIAGPCHWFECHVKGKSKPCLHVITNGELKCDRCSPFDPIQPIGYQPLYRESDGRPCMTVVHEYSREQIDALKLHQRVIVGRNKGSTDAVFVMPAMRPDPRYQSTLAERRRPADLTDTLLRVWAIPELCEWYNTRHPVSDTAVSLPTRSSPPPVAPTLPPVEVPAKGPIERLMEAEERAKREEAEEELKIGNTMNYLLNRVAKPNGSHKKK